MLAAHRVLHAPHASASYDSVILADSPSYYWSWSESSGTTAHDTADSNAGTWVGTVALGQTGIGDGETAVLLDGSSGMMETATQLASPGPQSPFTLECWIKTANGYASGGGLFGFADTQTGSTGTYDRQVWMDNSGKLNFGIFSGGVISIASTAAYNDGSWHYVVARIASSSNMSLWVDGIQVASNSNTSAPVGYTGYWRVGSLGGTSGWSPAPASLYLAATMAKVAIYNYALTSTQISNHYAAA